MKAFEGRNLLIVTKHGKEVVMAPHLTERLGVRCIIGDRLDTDALGTFAGEKQRYGSPLETLREKCRLGMALYDCDLAIASEGSFGAHPSVFFARADDEFVMLLDAKNDLEIVSRELSMETNFNGAELANENDFINFLDTAGFPEHAVIVKRSEHNLEGMVKGLTDRNLALSVFHAFLGQNGSAYVETDMRALYNPTRLRIIEKAVLKLTDRALTNCPACGTPGFGIIGSGKGLPCSSCRNPTNSILYNIHGCSKCHHAEKHFYPRGITKEDPAFCDYCNP